MTRARACVRACDTSDEVLNDSLGFVQFKALSCSLTFHLRTAKKHISSLVIRQNSGSAVLAVFLN